MPVNLKRNWFGPDGGLYLSSENPHDFPADWTLPSDAETVKEVNKELAEKPAPEPKK